MDSDKLDVVNVDVSDNDDSDLGMGCGDCGAGKSFWSIFGGGDDVRLGSGSWYGGSSFSGSDFEQIQPIIHTVYTLKTSVLYNTVKRAKLIFWACHRYKKEALSTDWLVIMPNADWLVIMLNADWLSVYRAIEKPTIRFLKIAYKSRG